jgi:hypothetical protein
VIMRSGFTLLLCLLLAGCPKGAAPLRLSEIPGAALLSGRGDSFKDPGVVFELSPAILRVCEHPDHLMATKVSWDVGATGAQAVNIWVGDARERGRLWIQGLPHGAAETGPWIGNGSTLRLVGAEGSQKGRTLAIVKVIAVECLADPSIKTSPVT